MRDRLLGLGLARAGRQRDIRYDVDGEAADLGDLLAAGDRYEVAKAGDGEEACFVGFRRLEIESRSCERCSCQVYNVPIIPKASKEELGLEASGIWSRGIEDTVPSPYLILTG